MSLFLFLAFLGLGADVLLYFQIATFLTLHILNFITPLTPSKHTSSFSSLTSSSSLYNNVRKVDITASGLRAVLGALVESSKEEETEEVDERDLFVKILPPVNVRVVLPPSMVVVGSVGKASSSSSTTWSWFASIGKTLASSSLSKGQAQRSNPGTVNPSSPKAHPAAPTSDVHPPTRFETFSSAWTSLVSDPILSKWIMLMLCLSVVLNGYLLRGIAAGLVGSGVFGERVVGMGGFRRWAGEAGTREGGTNGSEGEVRFVEGVKGEDEVKEDWKMKGGELRREIPSAVVEEKSVSVVVPPQERPDFPVAVPAMTPTTFTLKEVDRKLKAGKNHPHNHPHVVANPTPPATSTDGSSPWLSSSSSTTSLSCNTDESSSSSSSAPGSPLPTSPPPPAMTIRSLEECIDIFGNGPRPLSASLALLNDEEVILLAQNGKIAAYALEKVLGAGVGVGGAVELERAVRVRRALICVFFFSLSAKCCS